MNSTEGYLLTLGPCRNLERGRQLSNKLIVGYLKPGSAFYPSTL